MVVGVDPPAPNKGVFVLGLEASVAGLAWPKLANIPPGALVEVFAEPTAPNKPPAGFVCCWPALALAPKAGDETAGVVADNGLEVRAFPKRADGAEVCCPKEGSF